MQKGICYKSERRRGERRRERGCVVGQTVMRALRGVAEEIEGGREGSERVRC